MSNCCWPGSGWLETDVKGDSAAKLSLITSECGVN